MNLRTPLCDLLGIEVPICLAGMGGVAYADVCAAVSEAGGFGTLGMASASPDGIRDEMRRVRELTDKPFGVDLLAALPESMLASIDVIIDEGAKAFIAGLGVPGPVIQRCHDAGLLVMSMCGTVRAKPKFTPDAISIRLFGPGVIEDTKAKAASAVISSHVMAQRCAARRRISLSFGAVEQYFCKQ
jgi:NAD(P)H-dependent flavin oxidoreductase YrpB (nitropropane dioxygenase family)